jgi:hypothetical protein
LNRLGIPNAVDCIGERPTWGVGIQCYQDYGSRVTVETTIGVLIREPLIIVRQLQLALSAMQDLSIEWYGIYAIGDPRAGPGPPGEGPTSRPFWGARSSTPLNAWSWLKFHYFPGGWSLVLVLVAGGVVALMNWGRAGLRGGLAFIQIMTAGACLIDAWVAAAGEGVQDLVRHLFLANVLFDLSIIAAAGLLAVSLLERLRSSAHSLHAAAEFSQTR